MGTHQTVVIRVMPPVELYTARFILLVAPAKEKVESCRHFYIVISANSIQWRWYPIKGGAPVC